MPNEIRFAKTGNFWLDNGIVGLYQVLAKVKEEPPMDATDSPIRFEFGFEVKDEAEHLRVWVEEVPPTKGSAPELLAVLNAAKAKVAETYLTKTSGYGWLYTDQCEFALYQKTDFRMHLKPFFMGKTGKPKGTVYLPKDQESAKARDYVLKEDEPARFEAFKKGVLEGGKIKLTDKGYLHIAPVYEIGTEYEDSFELSGTNRCNFSGDSYKKTSTVSGMDYPFLTGDSGELNFASFLAEKPSIADKYSFVGVFAFYNLYFSLQSDFKNYFILNDGTLKDLEKFYRSVQIPPDQIEPQRRVWCNFKSTFIGAQYAHEGLMDFLISIYNQFQSKMANELEDKEMMRKAVYTFHNDGSFFREVRAYNSIETLFSFFDNLAKGEGENQKGVKKSFLYLLRSFQRKVKETEYDTTWRNRLCHDLLSFNLPFGIVEEFMAEVRLKEANPQSITHLDTIFKIFLKSTHQNMNEEDVNICKSIGDQIGEAFGPSNENKKGNKDPFFGLRNAKTREEFLRVFNEMQFKMEKQFFQAEDLLKRVVQQNVSWLEFKHLINIFAMNEFLKRDYIINKKNSQQS
jgi:hypothetical protein